MKIREVIQHLEAFAPPAYQESYDNAGLLTGSASWLCTGIICTLDATEDVVLEAKEKGCNLIVAHHPIIFGGLKKITGRNYVEQTVIAAIKNDIAIYAIHTNLDNVITGVNNKIADNLSLINRRILSPKKNLLMKLFTFVPKDHAEKVRTALFDADGGYIGNYSECSFNGEGSGTFKAGTGTNPFVGEIGARHTENEVKIEIIFPAFRQRGLISALMKAHPYEEPAFDIVPLANDYLETGSGLIGELESPISGVDMLNLLKTAFNLQVIRHTRLLDNPVKKVALCGGAGFFLLNNAIASGADIYITADVKYHEFFDADGKIVLADIGHWESEQFTIDLLFDILQTKFPTFAVLKTDIRTNPVYYY